MRNASSNRRRLVALAGLGAVGLAAIGALVAGSALATSSTPPVTTVPLGSTVTKDLVEIPNGDDACAAVGSTAAFGYRTPGNPLGIHTLAPGVTVTVTGTDSTGYTMSITGGFLVDLLLKAGPTSNTWYHFDPPVFGAASLFAPFEKEVSHITFCWDKVVPAKAKVKKISVPSGSEAGWTFTLTGPDTPVNGEHATTTDAGFVSFATPLKAGSYTIAETPKAGFAFTAKTADCAFTVTYPADSGKNFSCAFTNTQLGSLEVTKTVAWNGVAPDADQTFTICITGPSYAIPSLANGGCKKVGANGGKLTWANLVPGSYVVDETDPGSAWVVSGGDGVAASVDAGAKKTAEAITNTRKLGSLKITKNVDWNGITPDEDQSFEICVTGPSYPTGDCKSVDHDGGTLTWSNLVPGNYSATETNPGVSWSVSGSPSSVITVPTNGGTAANAPVITNTRKLGSLQVTKSVNWNGVTPNEDKTFEICITGPSYPGGDCKTVDHDGGTLTWSNLIPGDYTASETNPGASWTVAGSPSSAISVPHSGGRADNVPVITNTRQLGSLQVTKIVDWNGVTPDDEQTFEICITGPSYPSGDCKTVDHDGATLTWSNLVPGNYTATETNPGASWTVAGSPSSAISVPHNGGRADNVPVITNTRKLGSLQVVKHVNWNGVTPDDAQTFKICITGPSYPAPTMANGGCQHADHDGATLTWSELIPGNYAASEPNPGSSWIATLSVSGNVTVPGDGGRAAVVPEITNTRRLGSLQVAKSVNWNGVSPDENKTFEICITGPSYPGGDCKTVDFDGGTLSWSGLIPGDYSAAETNPGTSWTVAGSPTAVVSVPTDGSTADLVPVVTNTRKLGSLKVTKTVDWNGVTPDGTQSFAICVTGPSYPTAPDCKSVGASGGTLTWSELIPGAYVATETNPGSKWSAAGSPSGIITVPSDGGVASVVPVITNTRKLGSLQVTKTVNWNGVTPDESQSFDICVTGPSYPNGDCKVVDFDGGTATWSNLVPGAYTASETNPGSSWTVAGSPSAVVTVPADGSMAELVPVITNTRKLGSLQVTKAVDWNGVMPDDEQSFEICITGPSHPDGNCKVVDHDGATLVWSELIPGAYTATETNPGNTWTVAGSPSSVITVPNDGGLAGHKPVITNTRKLGSLHVTKNVDWNGVEPVEGEEFSICISGPSFPDEPDCETFTSPDALDQRWTGLIPGSYTITEAGLGEQWTRTGDTSATVPADGGRADAEVTNTRQLGSLSVTKAVDWNGATANEDKTFSLCITGPSFPDEADCKSVDFDGGTVTWDGLIPGDYEATEKNPGANWTIEGSPSATITVPVDGTEAELVPVITNTRKRGSLEVIKTVNWNGVTPDQTATFEICISGPSYPTGNCKPADFDGATLSWTGLLPGSYAVTETDPGASWLVAITGSPVTVPADGAAASATVTNTRRPIEVLGEVLARTGSEDTLPLAVAGLVVLIAAGRRAVRRGRENERENTANRCRNAEIH